MSKHSPKSFRRRVARAFTLFELLIAVSIMLIVLFVVDRLFIDATEVVRLGVAQHHVMANARAAVDQFHRDTQELVGPGDASTSDRAFLAIVNRTMWNDDANPDLTWPRVEANNPAIVAQGIFARPVISDQLIMFRRNAGTDFELTPAVPASSRTFAPPAGSYPYVRLFYGHGRRTNANGTAPNAGLGEDRFFASEYILARQALFLVDDSSGTPTGVYADSAQADATITGGFVSSGPSLPISTPTLADGYADVANVQLHSSGTNDAIVGTTASAALRDGIIDSTYKDAVYEYFFDADDPLSINPVPLVSDPIVYSYQVAQMHPYFMSNLSDFIVEFAADANNDGQIDTATTFTVDGDFIVPNNGVFGVGTDVEFTVETDPVSATDTTLPNGLAVDTTYTVSSRRADGGFRLQDSSGDPVAIGAAGTDIPPYYSQVTANSIIWYSGRRPPVEPPYDYITGWRIPTAGGTAQESTVVPLLDYLPYDNSTGMTVPGDDGEVDAFVWRHDDSVHNPGFDNHTKWPYLIRIRYRIHDERNKIMSPYAIDSAKSEVENLRQQTGRWFEHIFAAPRPTP